MSATIPFSNNTSIPRRDSQRCRRLQQDLGAYILLWFKTEGQNSCLQDQYFSFTVIYCSWYSPEQGWPWFNYQISMRLGTSVSHLSQECSTYTLLFPHVLTSCLNCHTFPSGITPAKFAAYRNTFPSATLAFQSHNQIPSSKSSSWPISKHKIHIISSNWENDTSLQHSKCCTAHAFKS